jgi:multidrug resistance efflux pump
LEAKKEEALQVSTTTPKTQMLRRYILQPGVVSSYEETPIYSKIAGYLLKVNVDIGDKITKNELLGELYVPEVEDEVRVRQSMVAQAKADITQTLENLKAAEANIITTDARVEEAKASVIRAVAFRKRWDDEYNREMGFYKKGDGFFNKKTLEEAEHQLDAAKKGVEETGLSVKSAEAALAESKAKRDKAAADVNVSRAQLTVWEHQLEEQKRWFEYAKITAPYDGIVTRRNIHTGHFVQPANSGTTSKAAEPLFVVMRTDLMRVVVPVPEYDAPLVKDGAMAIVRLQAYPGDEIVDKVERSSWSLDQNDRTLRVEIFLKNPDLFNLTEQVFGALRIDKVPEGLLAKLKALQDKEFSQADFLKELDKALTPDDLKRFKSIILNRTSHQKLRTGMYGNISIEADVPNTMCLPADAILTDGYRHYCFIIDEGKARKVPVKIGITNDAMTEVLSKQQAATKLGGEGAWVKFTGNEQVITSNLKSIQDGQPAVAK